MESKFTKAVNLLNEWRDNIMEERKHDLKSVLAAGRKVIAKLKNRAESKILSYDGDDCYYTDATEYGDFEITPEGYATPQPSAKEKFQSFVSGLTKKKENEINLDDDYHESFDESEVDEQTFDYYEKIMSKLDSLKDRGNETLNDFMKKAEGLFKSDNLTKQQLQDELDNLMIELDDKLGILITKSDDTSNAINGLTEQSKSNFESLSSSLTHVSECSDEMLQTLAEVGTVLKKSEAKIDEIHEASMGIDKLIDSVFELKNTSLQARNDIADIKKKQKFIKIWSIIAASVIGGISIAALTLQLITMLV